jgi:hypothetical protein
MLPLILMERLKARIMSPLQGWIEFVLMLSRGVAPGIYISRRWREEYPVATAPGTDYLPFVLQRLLRFL